MPETRDASRSALDHVHRLLIQPAGEQPALDVLLADLAVAFKAFAAGLANFGDPGDGYRFPRRPTAPASLPWQDDPSFFSRSGPVPGVVCVERPEGSLLATTVPGEEGARVLWLEDPARAAWTDAEAGALVLAGCALSRWLGCEPRPRWVEQLDRATRQQRLETVAGVTRRLAHDFGNVLTGILGFTELAMAQQVPANTPLHSYINEAYRAAQSGAQLTHQLRMFSRRQSSSSRSCPLSVVLADQEARLFSARETGVNLRLNVPTDLPAVALDAEHLGHVLSALLDNAREALMGPGSISVSARITELTDSECQDLFGSARPGPHIEIIIADTGAGLSPDAERRLFNEPFFTTKPRRRGFGLAITYGILHAHHGGLRLHPGGDRGLVARVLLPVARTMTPAVAVEEAYRPSERVRSERILVVDDDPEVLQSVAATLERAGYRIDRASSGEAALESYFAQTTDPYRLVLTDVVMPGMGGVDLLRRLVKRDPAARVLFMSGQVSAEFTREDFTKYAVELLSKPFRSEHLLKSVRAVLDRPAPRRTAREGGGEPANQSTHAKK